MNNNVCQATRPAQLNGPTAFHYAVFFPAAASTNALKIFLLFSSARKDISGCHWTAQTKVLSGRYTASMRSSSLRAISISPGTRVLIACSGELLTFIPASCSARRPRVCQQNTRCVYKLIIRRFHRMPNLWRVLYWKISGYHATFRTRGSQRMPVWDCPAPDPNSGTPAYEKYISRTWHSPP